MNAVRQHISLTLMDHVQPIVTVQLLDVKVASVAIAAKHLHVIGLC